MKKTIAICLAILTFAGILTACGGGSSKVDYSTWNYEQFRKADQGGEEYWNKKTLTYQTKAAYDETVEGENYIAEMLMPMTIDLYDDGSARGYCPSIMVIGGMAESIDDSKDHTLIVEMYYGYWTKASDGTISCYLLRDAESTPYSFKGVTVDSDPFNFQYDSVVYGCALDLTLTSKPVYATLRDRVIGYIGLSAGLTEADYEAIVNGEFVVEMPEEG